MPIDFGKAEKRTHDYKRHGTTNLFAALNVGTGEVVGDCRPSRNGRAFPAFLKKATAPHAGREIHVVPDNLSTHTTPDVAAWNTRAEPFVWTATADEILAKVRLVQANVKKLVDYNAK